MTNDNDWFTRPRFEKGAIYSVPLGHQRFGLVRILETLSPTNRGQDGARIAQMVHGLASGRLQPVAA